MRPTPLLMDSHGIPVLCEDEDGDFKPAVLPSGHKGCMGL